MTTAQKRKAGRIAKLAEINKDVLMAYEYYLNKVSAATGISIGQIKGRSREKDIVAARHMVSYLLSNHPYSLKAIGEAVGRDHSTIIHSRDEVLDGLSMTFDKRFIAVKLISPYVEMSDAEDFELLEVCG